MAGQARERARYRDAGILYEAAGRLLPDPHVSVQAGHMFKEAGDFETAEEHYLVALAALPDDADLALQMGHFYKVAGRRALAVDWYRKAAGLQPSWADPLRELEGLGVPAAGDGSEAPAQGGLLPPRRQAAHAAPRDRGLLRHFGGRPCPGEPAGAVALRGVESIRGVVYSTQALRSAELLVDGAPVADAPLVPVMRQDDGADKYVFNLWHDFSSVACGDHAIEIRIAVAAGGVIRCRRDAFVGMPFREADHPDSDAVVDGCPDPATSLDTWLHGRPSTIAPVRPDFFSEPPDCILVVRADQLGDMVVSVPAFRRLRAIAPAAKIVALVTPANADLARTLGLFDAVEVMRWDGSAATDERRMTAAEEQRVAAALQRHRPDVAIDLSVSSLSRPLLFLSGAPCTIGFADPASPWLTVDVAGRSHAVRTDHEMTPHGARLLAPIDRLASMINGGGAVVAPPPDAADRLATYGLTAGNYLVIHAGGRFRFTRWPHYPALVRQLLAEVVHDLVIFGPRDDVPPDVLEDPRIQVIDRELAFADFDAILAAAAAFVGNDSGPKHLAALRGAPVVSLHSARVDRREWGQTQTGLVISRRLPCAGCSLHAWQEDECGRDYACINDIKLDEVVAAVKSVL